MGSWKSKGKRVAPASETNVVDDDCVKADENKSSVEPFRVRASTSWANKNTYPDSQSVGQHSEWSTDLEGELEEILADSEQKNNKNKNSSVKKRFFSSKTFGLCNSVRVQNDDHAASSPQLPNAGLVSGPCHHAHSEMSVKEKLVTDKPLGKASGANTSQQQGWSASVGPEILSKDAALAPDTYDGPSLDKSVILYDATEEDMMKTIEREFS